MTTPYTVVAMSWSNDGTSIDTDSLVVTAGCKRCPTGTDIQGGPLATAGAPASVFVFQFPSLLAATNWKNSNSSNFDMICWLPTGGCC
ncbi:MAG: hypothetical protein JSR59_05060 [Proteobacteria bacterium]|nr:hypothetical protein [Pseudomonadota bacterium]